MIERYNPARPISCKAALFTPNMRQVLLTRYQGDGHYTLPGGRMEEGEIPDETIVRELKEELGIDTPEVLSRLDKFVHSSGKIIVAYMGVIPRDITLHPDRIEAEGADWVDVDRVDHVRLQEKSYRDYLNRIIDKNYCIN